MARLTEHDCCAASRHTHAQCRAKPTGVEMARKERMLDISIMTIAGMIESDKKEKGGILGAGGRT